LFLQSNCAYYLHYLVYRDGMKKNRAAQVVDNVQALLTSTGASRRSTAQASGIAPETFQRRLASVGGSPFTVTELDQLAKHFGVTMHSLVCCDQDSDAA